MLIQPSFLFESNCWMVWKTKREHYSYCRIDLAMAHCRHSKTTENNVLLLDKVVQQRLE